MPISFKVTIEDSRLIDQIVKRAATMVDPPFDGEDRKTITMDLTACHANGCPLKLAELLAADDFNFAHDVFGIRRHMNRRTGQLGDCFLPRFAKEQ